MNIIQNPTQERINALEAKVDNLLMAFERCLGVTLDSESTLSSIPLKTKAITFSLLEELDRIKHYDVALETLNHSTK